MNLKFRFNNLRRRTLMMIVVLALSAAMLPTAAFASGGSYGHQGRAWDPGPRQPRGYHRPAQDNHNYQNDDHGPWNNYNNNNNYNRHGNNYNHHPYNNHPNQCNTSYRVQRGDSLSGIAQHYGVSMDQLAKANSIRNPNRIYSGMVLCIPC
jgi:nucleoid-associated protein YgaU